MLKQSLKNNNFFAKKDLFLIIPLFALIIVAILNLDLSEAFVFGSVRVSKPAGSSGEIQFNSNNIFGAESALSWNSSTDVLTVSGTLDGVTSLSMSGDVDMNNNNVVGIKKLVSEAYPSNTDIDMDTSNLILNSIGRVYINMDSNGSASDETIEFQNNGTKLIGINQDGTLDMNTHAISGITTLVTSGTIKNQTDSSGIYTGASDDLRLYHDGTNSYLNNSTGTLILRSTDNIYLDSHTNILVRDADDSYATRLTIDSSNGNVAMTGALSGVTTLGMSGDADIGGTLEFTGGAVQPILRRDSTTGGLDIATQNGAVITDRLTIGTTEIDALLPLDMNSLAISGVSTLTATTVTDGTFSVTGGAITGATNTNWDDSYSKRVDTWGDGLEYSGQTATVDFNTTNLKITSGELNTIQDLNTSATPTFAQLTITNAPSSGTDAINKDALDSAIQGLD